MVQMSLHEHIRSKRHEIIRHGLAYFSATRSQHTHIDSTGDRRVSPTELDLLLRFTKEIPYREFEKSLP